MTKIKLSFFVITALLLQLLTFVPIASAVFEYNKETIDNQADAEAFCRAMPDGNVVNVGPNLQTCYYKKADSAGKCELVAGGRGSSGNENCGSFETSRLVGQKTDDVFTILGYSGVKTENLKSKNPPPTVTPQYVEEDCSGPDIQAGNGSCALLDYLVIAINVLSAVAGLVIIGSIVYAGIQYSSAGGDTQKVSAAKDRIRNAIIALLLMLFGYAILNYLVPGGIL